MRVVASPRRRPLALRLLVALGLATRSPRATAPARSSLRPPAAPAVAASHPRFVARRRAIEADQRKQRRRVAASVGAFAALLLGGFGAARSPLLAVDAVRVVGLDASATPVVEAVAAPARGQNLLDVDLAALEARVGRLPWVAAVAARRVAPSTVEIRVDAREPFAVVRTPAGAATVDRAGVVLERGTPDAPLVPVDSDVAVLPLRGDTVADAGVRNALSLHAGLPADVRRWIVAYDAATPRQLRARVRVHGDGAVVDAWVRFGAAERVGDKAHVLAALVGRVQEAGAVVAEFDVRSPERPVVVPAQRASTDPPGRPGAPA